jgi:predicted transcriptional regulator
MTDETQANELIALTADIVTAHVSHNNLSSSELPALIQSIHAALSGLGAAAAPAVAEKPKGAVGVRASIKPDFLISMIDGKSYKMLRRHIAQHGYTPESYRETFGLPRDYPLVSANYAEQRRSMAHKIGLGRKPAAPAAAKPAKAVAPRRKLKPAFGDAVAAAKEHLGAE